MWRNVTGKENPENNILGKPENMKKYYHEWETYFSVFEEQNVSLPFDCVIHIFIFSAAQSKMSTYGKCIVSFRTIAKGVIFWKCSFRCRAIGNATFLKM
jgi:hypothetical protein